LFIPSNSVPVAPGRLAITINTAHPRPRRTRRVKGGGTYILDDENSGYYAEIPIPTTNWLAGLNDRAQIVGWNNSNGCDDGLILDSNLLFEV